MSEAQSPTGTLNLDGEQLSARDVDFLHKIVVRAQDEPQGTDRSSLLTAYQAALQEHNLDPTQDDVLFWLLLEILKPEVEGHTLLEKFDHVMRSRGIEVIFEDDISTQDSAHSQRAQSRTSDQPQQPRRMSEVSGQSSQVPDIADQHMDTDQHEVNVSELDQFIHHPPAHVARLEYVAEVHIRKTLLKLAFDTWRDEAAARRQLRDQRTMMEQHADHVYERRLRYKVVSHWCNLKQQIDINRGAADDFYLYHKNGSILTTLRDTARVNRIQAMEDVRLQGLGLYKLTVASRESAFSRKLDDKLKRQCFSALLLSLQATTEHQHELQGRLENVIERPGRRDMGSAFYMMYHKAQHASQHFNVSGDLYSTKLRAAAMARWTDKAQHLQHARTAIEDARNAFLMRKYFCKMKDKIQTEHQRQTILATKTLDAWQDFVRERQDRRTALAKQTLQVWRKFTRVSKARRYRTLYEFFRDKYKRELTRTCFRKVRARAQTITNMQQTAIDHYDARLNAQTTEQAHDALRTWYKIAHARKQQTDTAIEVARRMTLEKAWRALTDKRQQVKHLELVGESFYDLHAQSVSRRCLKTISRKAFEIHCRQQDADAFRNRYERQVLRSRWDEWRRKVAENRGEGPLILPPATPAQRRADQLNRLASTTPLFAPRTSFAARLRGDVQRVEGIEEDGQDET